MKKIGLTGGIGSGKSTASKIFSSLGIPVVDADRISHSILAPSSPYIKKVSAVFGKEILDQEGNIDRTKLGERIFSSKEEREKLEKIVHPLVREEMHRQIRSAEKSGEKLVVLDIPLLFEGGYWLSQVDEVWLIDVPEHIQIKRLMERDPLNEKEVKRRISAQWPIQQKREMATQIIDNSGTVAELEEKIKFLVDQEKKKEFF